MVAAIYVLLVMMLVVDATSLPLIVVDESIVVVESVVAVVAVESAVVVVSTLGTSV